MKNILGKIPNEVGANDEEANRNDNEIDLSEHLHDKIQLLDKQKGTSTSDKDSDKIWDMTPVSRKGLYSEYPIE